MGLGLMPAERCGDERAEQGLQAKRGRGGPRVEVTGSAGQLGGVSPGEAGEAGDSGLGSACAADGGPVFVGVYFGPKALRMTSATGRSVPPRGVEPCSRLIPFIHSFPALGKKQILGDEGLGV